jgi:hypothetical protein
MAFDFLGDMDNVFLNSGFEEDIVYNEVTIPAVVDRGDVMMLGRNGITGNTGMNIPKFKVSVMVSKTDVPYPVIRDDIVVLSHHGRAADVLRVQSIIVEDAGAFTLGLA